LQVRTKENSSGHFTRLQRSWPAGNLVLGKLSWGVEKKPGYSFLGEGWERRRVVSGFFYGRDPLLV